MVLPEVLEARLTFSEHNLPQWLSKTQDKEVALGQGTVITQEETSSPATWAVSVVFQAWDLTIILLDPLKTIGTCNQFITAEFLPNLSRIRTQTSMLRWLRESITNRWSRTWKRKRNKTENYSNKLQKNWRIKKRNLLRKPKYRWNWKRDMM